MARWAIVSINSQHVDWQATNTTSYVQPVLDHIEQSIVVDQGCHDYADMKQLVTAGPDIESTRGEPFRNSQNIQHCADDVNSAHSSKTPGGIGSTCLSVAVPK